MNYLIIATICFSLSFGLIKQQLVSVPSDIVVELRLLLAAIIFLPFLKKLELKKYLIAGLIGIVQFGLMYSFFIRAFKYLQGNEVVLLTTTTPVFVAICSAIFGEKFKLSYILCILLAIFGAVIVIWENVSFNFLIKGIILMEACNFSFALGQVLWRKYIGESDTALMVPAYLFAALIVLPFSIFNTDFSSFSLNINQIFSILYLGIVPTGIGFWLWNKGVRLVKPSTLAIMNNLKIPMGVFFALVLFKENVNLYHFLIGSLFIITAAFFSQKVLKDNNS